MQIPCVYIPGPAPAVSVANIPDGIDTIGRDICDVHDGPYDDAI